jgi:hypothetical protein
MLDLVTEKIWDLFRNSAELIRATTLRAHRELLNQRKKVIEARTGEARSITERLKAHAAWVEGRVAGLLARHSPAFWLSLERRFPPHLDLKNVKSFPGNELAVLKDARMILTALLFKHGSWHLQDWSENSDGTLSLNPAAQDVVDLWGYIRPFLAELSNLPITYRGVAKGLPLHLDGAGEFLVELTGETGECVKLYQQRRSQFPQSFSPVGNFLAIEGSFATTLEECDLMDSLATFEINEDSGLEFEIPSTPAKLRSPGYRPFVGRLNEFYQQIAPFGEKLRDATNLTVEEMRLSIASLNKYVCEVFAGRGAYTCLTRGAIFVETNLLMDKLAQNLGLLARAHGRSTDPRRVIENSVSLLTVDAQDIKKFDVFERRHCRCLFQVGKLIVIDLTLIGHRR